MASLKDIARIAGVSVSTVSKALNGSSEIKAETADSVIKAAKALNYTSNKSTSALNNAPSNIIGIIAPEVISSFYSLAVGEIQRFIQQNGYAMLTAFSNFDPKSEIELLYMLAGKQVDGIIIISPSGEETTNELEGFRRKCNIPVVQIVHAMNPSAAANNCDGFMIDDEMGMQLVVQHLTGLGHTEIGFVGDTYSVKRKEFFMYFMEQHGLSVAKTLLQVGSERFEYGGYLRMQALLKSSGKPTAVVASYDNIAFGAMRAIYEKGLRIPQDISIVGFDDATTAGYLFSPLTTVSLPITDLGQLAVRALLNKVSDKTQDLIQHVILKPKLVIRATTMEISR